MKNTHMVRFFGLVLLGSSFLVSGCIPGRSGATPDDSASPTPVAEKSGTTTMRGTLQIQGKLSVLKTPTATVELSSYDVDLTPYNGKSVSVTGKFSGDTLFVSSITE